MPIVSNGQVVFSGGEALPAVGSQSYKDLASGIAPGQEPASPVPSLSSSAGADAIDQAVSAHKADMAAIPKAAPAGQNGYVNSAGTYVPPSAAPVSGSGSSVTADEASAAGIDLTKYSYDPATKLYTPALQAATGNAQYEADQKTINDAFAGQVAGMDSATQALINSIKGIYSSRIADQAEANRRELASFNTMNTRYGTARYAPGVGQGILTADERVGLDRISKIAAEEAGLIAQANQSLQDKKYAAFVEQRNELTQLRKDRVATLQKLQDDAYKAQQDKIKNSLDQKIHDDTVSYQDKQLAIQQANLDETVRKNKMAELQKAADLKVKQDAANLLTGALAAPVQKTNGVVNPSDQEAFLSKYSPEMQVMIKGVANYEIDPGSASKRAGAGISPLQLQTLAKAYNPDYRANQYQAISAFLKSWSSGGNNSVTQSANTVVQHLEELSNVVDKVGNAPAGALGPFTESYNSARQWANEGASDPNIMKFKQDALLIATEMAKIMKNGSGSNAAPTDDEIRQQLSIITTNLSPATAKAVITNSVQLMGDRLNTARENYINVVGSDPGQILLPSAQHAVSALKQKGYQVDLSSLDPSPLAGVSDAELVGGISGGAQASSTPSQYFSGLLDLINSPQPSDASIQ